MCGLSIINKTLTVGQFTILNNYYNIIMQQLRYFLNLGTNFQKFRVSMNRLQEILSIKTDKDGNILLNEIHSIKIKGLRNSFEKNELKSFTYEFYSGKIYCLNGANGTGKSSLINSLLNIDQDYEGKVYINDIDISDLNMTFIRKHLISLSEQTPIIFDKDIDYNLNLFNNTSLNDIFTNSEFIKKNISANTLSGGEKKKIALLRTVSKNSDVLIFDEPEASLDKESIGEFINYIKETRLNKIIIIITHNIEINNIADYQIYL